MRQQVKAAAGQIGIQNRSGRSAPNMCATLPSVGRRLQQIQFLLGHASIETTEKYLGCKQKLSPAVNDATGLEDA